METKSKSRTEAPLVPNDCPEGNKGVSAGSGTPFVFAEV